MKQKFKTKLPKSYRRKKKEIKIYNNVVIHQLDGLEWLAMIIGLLFLLFPTHRIIRG